MVDSNAKGSRGELKVRDFITSWWRPVEAGTFARTPRSGGMAVAGEFDMAGDLMTKAKSFPFCIEVKNREAWSLDTLVEGMPSPVWGWWAQACRDGAKTTPPRIPMLWFTKRGLPWFVMVPWELVRQQEGMPAPDVMFSEYVFRERQVATQSVVYLARRLLEADPLTFSQIRRASAG